MKNLWRFFVAHYGLASGWRCYPTRHIPVTTKLALYQQQFAVRILPRIFCFFSGGGLKSQSSTYIEKIFPCKTIKK